MSITFYTATAAFTGSIAPTAEANFVDPEKAAAWAAQAFADGALAVTVVRKDMDSLSGPALRRYDAQGIGGRNRTLPADVAPLDPHDARETLPTSWKGGCYMQGQTPCPQPAACAAKGDCLLAAYTPAPNAPDAEIKRYLNGRHGKFAGRVACPLTMKACPMPVACVHPCGPEPDWNAPRDEALEADVRRKLDALANKDHNPDGHRWFFTRFAREGGV